MCVLLAASVARAEESADPRQVTFVPHFDARLRTELRVHPFDVGAAGTALPGATTRADGAGGGTTRLRLGIDGAWELLRLRTNVQDARIFGGPEGSSVVGDPGAGQLSLFEGYLELRGRARADRFVRVGRQVIEWGEGRLIGAQDWSVRGRSFDSVHARLPLGRSAHLAAFAALEPPAFGTRAATSVGYRAPAAGRALFGGQLGAELHPLVRVELLAVGRVSHARPTHDDEAGMAVAGLDPAASSSLQRVHTRSQIVTGSLRVFGELSGLRYSIESALQGGRAQLPSGPLPVFAHAHAARISRRSEELGWAPEPELGASYASGDETGSRAFTQFDPLVPNPLAYGWSRTSAWSNVASAHAGLTLHPRESLAFGATYRYLRFASHGGDWISGDMLPIADRASASLELGHQVDGHVDWQMIEAVLAFRAGGSVLALGQGAKEKIGTATVPVHLFAQLVLSL